MTRYDFTKAEKQLNEWFSPKQLMAELQHRALELSAITTSDDAAVRNMQRAVLSVCYFLETIKEDGDDV